MPSTLPSALPTSASSPSLPPAQPAASSASAATPAATRMVLRRVLHLTSSHPVELVGWCALRWLVRRQRRRKDVDDDPVAVAAVERSHELRDAAVGHPRGALEQEDRVARRDAEQRGLLGLGQGGLDGLRAGGHRGLEAGGEQVVERRALQVGAGEAGRHGRAARAGPRAPSARRRRAGAGVRGGRRSAGVRRGSRPASRRPGRPREATVWLPGRRPRARMSDENDDAASRCDTLASRAPRRTCPTRDGGPAARRRRARRRARRSVIRATPSSWASTRSAGSRSPGRRSVIRASSSARTCCCLEPSERLHRRHRRPLTVSWAGRLSRWARSSAVTTYVVSPRGRLLGRPSRRAA